MNNKAFMSTRENSLPTKMKFGFTLAETLITLGIIGVVAAITIPDLIANYQKHVTVTKLQKAISILNQAYKMSYDDVGEPTVSEAFAMGSNEYFNKYWAPYIKTAIICTTPAQCGYKNNVPWKLPDGQISNSSLIWEGKRVTFYTPDGFLYVIFTGSGGEATGGVRENGAVWVDINGGREPNTFGKDLFMLTRVEKDGGGVQPYGYDLDSRNIDKNCKKGDGGSYCAEKIRRAGWKIEKDYPW